MNQRDRTFFAEVYKALNEVQALGPKNPADIRRHAEVSQLARGVAGDLASAISSHAFEDFDYATDFLADARAKLDADERAIEARSGPSASAPEPSPDKAPIDRKDAAPTSKNRPSASASKGAPSAAASTREEPS